MRGRAALAVAAASLMASAALAFYPGPGTHDAVYVGSFMLSFLVGVGGCTMAIWVATGEWP